MKHRVYYIVGNLLLLAVLSCSLGGPLREDKKANTYQYDKPNDRWEKQVYDVDADSIFVNQETGAVISVNSLCERYETASLPSLMKSALAPLSDRKIISTEEITIDDRSALQEHLTAQIDGVYVEVVATVMRKDNCLFDFNLQGSVPLNKQDIEDFKNSLKSFHYRKYNNS